MNPPFMCLNDVWGKIQRCIAVTKNKYTSFPEKWSFILLSFWLLLCGNYLNFVIWILNFICTIKRLKDADL